MELFGFNFVLLTSETILRLSLFLDQQTLNLKLQLDLVGCASKLQKTGLEFCTNVRRESVVEILV